MTAVSALLLAMITGWLVPAPRLAVAAFLGPWLVVLIYQTADIGLGYAVSPPQTVTQFPRVIGYVVVTAIILALGLILSGLIGERRSRAVPDPGRPTAREMVRRATVAGMVGSSHHQPESAAVRDLVHRAVPARHRRPGHAGAAAPGRGAAGRSANP